MVSDFVTQFRRSAPYINRHRGGTFVVLLNGDVLKTHHSIFSDIALLDSLGIHLVLVTCAQSEIKAELKQAGTASQSYRDQIIITEEMISILQAAVGTQRILLESLMSMGLPDTPMHHSNIRVAGGNFVIARPLGVIDGLDCARTGAIRQLKTDFIREELNAGAIVHLGCLGYSITGEVFSLQAEELAVEAAIGLAADKLIILTEEPLLNHAGKAVSELGAAQLSEYMVPAKDGSLIQRHLRAISKAMDHQIERCHLLDYGIDGVLLQELFSHEGGGLQVVAEPTHQVRPAALTDIGGILALITPLEQEGMLIRRSRSQLEQEIDHFMVIEFDGLITGCVALYPIPESKIAELACLATRLDRTGEGEDLLNALENQARAEGIEQLFVLTTQAEHWFITQGFGLGKLTDLPEHRQQFYNFQRNSKALFKSLR